MTTVTDVEQEGAQVNEGLTARLSVSEIFGITFQGEGPSIGTPCYFLRLGGCNQHCTWCDTPYTWAYSDALAAKHQSGRKYDPREELKQMEVAEVYVKLNRMRYEQVPDQLNMLLVISGGEPMLQQKKLVPLMLELTAHQTFWQFEIETAGTIVPMKELTVFVNRFNVSPKLENSKNPLQQRYKPTALKALQATGKAAWKFVVQTPEDLKEVDFIVHENNLSPVYIMPEGISEGAINTHSQVIAKEVLKRGWHLTTRLQILLYGNQRGV